MSYIGKTTVSGSGVGTINTDVYVNGGVYSNGALLGSGGGSSNTFWGDVSFNNGNVYIGGSAKFGASTINSPQYYIPTGMNQNYQALFTASASSNLSMGQPYMAFDGNEATNSWITQATAGFGGTYNQFPYNSSGVYQGATGSVFSTTVSSVAVAGEWIQIQCPNAIISTGFYVAPALFSIISSGTIAGSNNGTTWFNLATISSNVSSSTVFASLGGSYTYYRLIITSINASSNYFMGSVAEFSVYSAGTNSALTGIQNISGVSGGTLAVTGNFSTPTTSTTSIGAATFSQAFTNYPQTNLLMISNSGTANGVTYTASASSVAPGNQACSAFNGNFNDTWTSNNSQFGTYNQNPYNNTTGAYQGATGNFFTTNGVNGEWLQIQSTAAIIATSFTYSGSPPISSGYVMGSTNGTTWTTLPTLTSFPSTNNVSTTFTFFPANTTPYTYYRLVIASLSTTVGTGATNFYLNIGEFSVNVVSSATSVTGLQNLASNTLSLSYSSLPNLSSSNIGYYYSVGGYNWNTLTSASQIMSIVLGAGVYLVEIYINSSAFPSANTSLTVSGGITSNSINTAAQMVLYTNTTSQTLSGRITTVVQYKTSNIYYINGISSAAGVSTTVGYSYTRIA